MITALRSSSSFVAPPPSLAPTSSIAKPMPLGLDGPRGEAFHEVDTSALGEPTLPASEAQLPPGERHMQDEAVAGVLGFLQSALSEHATLATVCQSVQRGRELIADPSQSVFSELLGADFNAQLAKLSETFLPQRLPFDADAAARLVGPALAAKVEAHSADSLVFMQTLFGGSLLGMTQEQLESGAALIAPALRDAAQGIAPKVGAQGDFGPYGFVEGRFSARADRPRAGGAQIVTQLLALAEGCAESLIGMLAIMQSDSHKHDLAALQQTLQALKTQKLGLLGMLQRHCAEIAGKELGGAMQAAKAEKAAAEAKFWGIFKSVLLVIVAVVVIVASICASPFSGGASLLAGIAAVCAIVSAVVTIVQQLPALLQLLAAIFDALGLKDVAASIDRAAAWLEERMTKSEAFKIICLGVQIACAVCSLGCGFASLAGTAQTVVETGINATDIALKAVNVAAHVLQVVASVTIALVQRDLIAATRAIEQLKGQLAMIEVEIAQVMNEVARVERSEDHAQAASEHAEELNSAFFDRLRDMASRLRDTTDALFM